jgi:DNA-directed RNA polymerase subunit RPC12/RpoP
MTFQAGKCPECGGDLQLPDDRTTVKCMYCGVDVTVQEVIQLSRSRVEESTTATPVKDKPNQGCAGCLAVVGGFLSVLGIIGWIAFVFDSRPLVLRDMTPYEYEEALGNIGKLVGLGLFLLVAGFIWYRTTPEKLVGFEADCPYCQTSIRMPPNNIGADCPACKKRIVFRDMKFFSVDTPVRVSRD